MTGAPDSERRNSGQTVAESAPSGFVALPADFQLERYVIRSVIAGGGFGITYRAEHAALGKTYAIKEHFPRQFAYREGASTQIRASDGGVYSWSLERFVGEARALADCHHPSVVGVVDVFEANGTAYMVLEYEPGGSFARWLNRLGRRPTQDEIDAILHPLLDALEFVHGRGLLHRDIAPDNILIRGNGQPCLIDFGAARQAVFARSQMMSAVVKGGFSPPEQYSREGKLQGPWTDLYALAATLYFAITRHNVPDSPDRVLTDEMPSLATLLDKETSYRPGFVAAIERALSIKPADRPQSVAAFRAEVSGASAPHSVTPDVTPSEAVAPVQPAPSPRETLPQMGTELLDRLRGRFGARTVYAAGVCLLITLSGAMANLAGMWTTPWQQSATRRGGEAAAITASTSLNTAALDEASRERAAVAAREAANLRAAAEKTAKATAQQQADDEARAGRQAEIKALEAERVRIAEAERDRARIAALTKQVEAEKQRTAEARAAALVVPSNPVPAPPRRIEPEPKSNERTYRVGAKVSDGILNLRTGPGTGHSLVASIPAGSVGVVVATDSCRSPDDGKSQYKWCRAKWRGYTGWLSSGGLAK